MIEKLTVLVEERFVLGTELRETTVGEAAEQGELAANKQIVRAERKTYRKRKPYRKLKNSAWDDIC